MSRHSILSALLFALLATGLIAATSAAQAQGPSKGVVVAAESQPPVWVGMTVAEPTTAIREQLGLPAKQGLVVNRITDGSPADKAGLKLRDVILSLGDKQLGTLEEIMGVVARAGEKPLTVHVIREGEPLILTLTPVRRGEPAPVRESVGKATKPEQPGETRRAVAVVVPEGSARAVVTASASGSALPTGSIVLPAGMSLSLRVSANEATKISIKRGDKNWEITADQIDTLPADVRAITQAYLYGLVSKLGQPQISISVSSGGVTVAQGLPNPAPQAKPDPKKPEAKPEAKPTEPKRVENKPQPNPIDAAKLAAAKAEAEARQMAERAQAEANAARAAAKKAQDELAARSGNEALEKIAGSLSKLTGELQKLNDRVKELESRVEKPKAKK